MFSKLGLGTEELYVHPFLALTSRFALDLTQPLVACSPFAPSSPKVNPKANHRIAAGNPAS